MTDPGTVRAAIDKLREDAGTWARTATGAQTLADVAQGLHLTGVELSFAADETGLTATYQQLQQRLAALCQQAVGALNGVAGNLTSAADGYEAIEQTNRATIDRATTRAKPPR